MPVNWATFALFSKLASQIYGTYKLPLFAYYFEHEPHCYVYSRAGKIDNFFNFMELYGFIQFVSSLSFEQTLLWIFIMFQKVVPYELLDSRRHRY